MSYYDLEELSTVYNAVVYLEEEYGVSVPCFRGSSIMSVKLQVNLEIGRLLDSLVQSYSINYTKIKKLRSHVLK